MSRAALRENRGHPPHPRRAPRCLTAPQPSVGCWP